MNARQILSLLFFIILLRAVATAAPLTFSVGSATGVNVTVPVRVMGFVNIRTVQFTFRFDSTHAHFTGVSGMPSENFGMAHVAEGIITVSWDAPLGKTMLDGASLFSVNFSLIGYSEARIDGSFIPVEVTNSADENIIPELLPGRLDGNEPPRISKFGITAGVASGQFSSCAGVSYQVQVSAEGTPLWSDIGSAVVSDGRAIPFSFSANRRNVLVRIRQL